MCPPDLWRGDPEGRRGALADEAPPHSWRGDPEGRRGSLADEAPPHSWGGGGEAAGGARPQTRLLPIHGEVAAKPPDGLARKHPRLDHDFSAPRRSYTTCDHDSIAR